jgi:polyisoprenoid-binding protein YceI
MAIPEGTHTLGPDNATMRIRTTKAGAASKAGHNLVIEVGSWEATVVGSDGGGEITVSADSRSLTVLEGTGGVKALTDEDKANIRQTIDDDVLKGCDITFRSSSLMEVGSTLKVQGELALGGKRNPAGFDLTIDDGGRVTASATVKQTDFGIKPYSALFGTLKVGDEVQIEVEGTVG